MQSGLMGIPADGGIGHKVPGAEWAEIDDVRQLPRSRDLIVLGRLTDPASSQIFDRSGYSRAGNGQRLPTCGFRTKMEFPGK